MKNILKFISLLLTLIMIISLFCGCNELDNLKDRVAYRTETSDIKLGDNIYMRLPSSEELRANYDVYSDIIYVVEKDIPVLLSGIVGDNYTLDSDGILLANDENIIYCQSDYYEQIKGQIENGFEPSRYCYGYYKLTDDEYAGDWAEYTLTEEELKAVKTVLSGEGDVLADNMNVLYDYIVNIEYCSEDGFFYKSFCDVYIHNDSYTVVTNNETETRTYDVPKELNGIFKNMVDEYIENEQLWYE